MFGKEKKQTSNQDHSAMVPLDLIDFPVEDLRVVDPADAEEINQIGESVASYKLINPVVLEPKEDGRFWVRDGRRRIAGVRRKGGKEILARVLDGNLSDGEAIFVGLVCNASRKDVNPVERALAVRRILDSGFCISPVELAAKLGWCRSRVSQCLAMAALPSAVIDRACKEGGAKGGGRKLTESVLRELTRLNEKAEWRDQAVELARRMVEEDIGLPELSLLVDRAIGAIPEVPRRGRPRHPKPQPIEGLPPRSKGSIKPGEATFKVSYDMERPLRDALLQLAGVFQQEGFDPSASLNVNAEEDSTPAFWDSGEGQVVGVSEDSCLAGSVGTSNGGEV